MKVEQEVPNEFLLVLDDGDTSSANGPTPSDALRRGKGAYYKNIERKMMLKKRRVNVGFSCAFLELQLTDLRRLMRYTVINGRLSTLRIPR